MDKICLNCEKQKKDFETARIDIINLMKCWLEESEHIEAQILSGLTVFIEASLNAAECKHSILKILSNALATAAENTQSNCTETSSKYQEIENEMD